MTLLQFTILSLFVIVCIVVTYLNTRKLLSLQKQRDTLALALGSLISHVNIRYPQGLQPNDNAMFRARQALRSVVESEKNN
jgi:hypothetical protein